MGSYFGSELCPVDIDMDGTTDFLLVAAPFYHVRGQEGKVYVYRLSKQVGGSPPLHTCAGCGHCLVPGWWRWSRPGPALRGKAGWGGAQGGQQLTPPTPVPHFLLFPISSSHIGADNTPSGSQRIKQALSITSPVSLAPGRQLLLTL